jgi:hypothetical protein
VSEQRIGHVLGVELRVQLLGPDHLPVGEHRDGDADGRECNQAGQGECAHQAEAASMGGPVRLHVSCSIDRLGEGI